MLGKWYFCAGTDGEHTSSGLVVVVVDWRVGVSDLAPSSIDACLCLPLDAGESEGEMRIKDHSTLPQSTPFQGKGKRTFSLG